VREQNFGSTGDQAILLRLDDRDLDCDDRLMQLISGAQTSLDIEVSTQRWNIKHHKSKWNLCGLVTIINKSWKVASLNNIFNVSYYVFFAVIEMGVLLSLSCCRYVQFDNL